MSRIINFSNGTECSRNNPFFKVIFPIGTKYLVELLDFLLVQDAQVFPYLSRSAPLYFIENVEVRESDINPPGVIRPFMLTFSEELRILDTFVTNSGRNWVVTFSDVVTVSEIDIPTNKRNRNITLSFIEKLDLSASN
jgi:hypothetical protein